MAESSKKPDAELAAALARVAAAIGQTETIVERPISIQGTPTRILQQLAAANDLLTFRTICPDNDSRESRRETMTLLQA